MGKNKDWWPSSRDEQLAMAKEWAKILIAVPPHWGINEYEALEFINFATSAEEALQLIRDRHTRTPIAREDCDEAFEILEIAARNLKKRYFHVPPLKRSDLIALWLSPAGKNPTPAGIPTDRMMPEISVAGHQEFDIKVVYLDGATDSPANNAFRVYYSVLDKDKPAPSHQSELQKSFSVRKKRFPMAFDPADSGKICYMAVQIENYEGKKGPWGPMVSTSIP